MKKINFLFLLIILPSCISNIDSFTNCSFPKHSPFPGGIINLEIFNLTFPKPNKDQLLCQESLNSWRIIQPIPLSYNKNNLKLYIDEENFKEFKIINKVYRVSKIQINQQKFIHPSKKDNERAAMELALMNKAFTSYSNKRFFSDLSMQWPVEGIISSEFGVRRFINGNQRNPHLGTDIFADIGTKIVAPLEGKVILVGNFFYRGNVIFIDHGNGLISSYSHLSEILVKKGDFITKNELIGKVGKSGRVTGPHLHWQVTLKGIHIDPEIFLRKKNL